jgi:hypothetical protein
MMNLCNRKSITFRSWAAPLYPSFLYLQTRPICITRQVAKVEIKARQTSSASSRNGDIETCYENENDGSEQQSEGHVETGQVNTEEEAGPEKQGDAGFQMETESQMLIIKSATS